MIYLDNGATTFPKPQSVINSVNLALRNFSANPGRGGHKLAIKASEMVYNARKAVADFFTLSDPSNVVFTHNCTEALNFVIKGLVKSGDHIIISSLEHNAVSRPIEKLKSKNNITYTVAKVVEGDNEQTLNNFRNAIQENTKLLVCTYASNVFGIKLPIERICAMCHQYGILTCVDAAQAAGIIPIDLSDSSIDYLCVAGHKGLYAPMGTGVLIFNCNNVPDSLIEGGTGSNSNNLYQPDILPDKFESGTANFSGIVGLKSGIDFVNRYGSLKIYHNEINHIKHAYNCLKSIKKVKLYTNEPDMNYYAPVLSFNIDGIDCETVSSILSEKYNIATRAGLHCAPLAHKAFDTFDIGTVRVVPSVFTTRNDINSLINAVYNIK
ncbi:MAG: aminotransferase class V-fold PLP-dependent enzyme [Ruminococcus sp.]|nr:aminotransferase class V-fold PLP-dependent enzyme [Ruminococcus sp.]